MSTRLTTTADFAEAAGISNRNARRAMARALQGKSWRGVSLRVEPLHGRGGTRGWSYGVVTDSLPQHIQDALKAQSTPVALPSIVEHRGAERDWWLRMLGPLLGMERGGDRTAAVEAIVKQRNLTDWCGRPIKLTARTIYRRLQKYRDHGPLAFAPRHRADKGVAKCLISLAAEQAIPFDDATWEHIAGDLRDYIRGHWKAGVTLKLIEANASARFRELIEAAGFDHCHTLSDKTFVVPRRFVVAERPYRNVHTLYHDRKTYEDNRFRTTRSRAGMRPMDWLVGDVHPLDIVMLREDGSTAHARLIAWLDVATNRLWVDLVLCEAGTGIRNADLIHSFLSVVAAWGLPKTLYIDNGGEYRFADDLNDALQLVAELRGCDGRGCRIARARPYNAAAKPIEGMFAYLERMLQHVPGHTGGDRLNKKTERAGRPTLPFSGPLAQLNAIVQGHIAYMHALPMRGALAGRSPNQVYQAAIDAGWQPVAVDPAEILTVFATDRVCTITKGAISVDGRRWFCDELTSYFEAKIVARVPRFWPAEKLALLHVKTRALIGIAEPAPAFAFDDPAGARLSASADRQRRKAIAALDRTAPTIDTVAETLRHAAALPPPPSVTPIATVGVSDEASEIARSIAEPEQVRADRRRNKALAEQRRHGEAMDRLLAGLKKGKAPR